MEMAYNTSTLIPMKELGAEVEGWAYNTSWAYNTYYTVYVSFAQNVPFP